MSFYLVVVVFLLNAIFGIIFDTFGHLRDERSAVQQDMKNCKSSIMRGPELISNFMILILACFICSVPAVEFQRHAKRGFEDHVKNDHNIW
jgi:heme/copper-type cytochrome/quinol oxidase subunit 3